MTVEWIIFIILAIAVVALAVTHPRRNGPGPGVE